MRSRLRKGARIGKAATRRELRVCPWACAAPPGRGVSPCRSIRVAPRGSSRRRPDRAIRRGNGGGVGRKVKGQKIL